jgi:hypothetical protein
MEKINVKILSKCQDCEAQAFLPSGMGVDYYGEEYQRYTYCLTCYSSGRTS